MPMIVDWFILLLLFVNFDVRAYGFFEEFSE